MDDSPNPPDDFAKSKTRIILTRSPLARFQQIYRQTSIDILYPELQHAETDHSYLAFLAHWDFATALTDNARRYLFCQQIAFTRLNELHVLSYLQRPQFDGPIEHLSRLYCQWAQEQFTLALSFFGRAVAIRYNLLALELILASTIENRLITLQKIRQLSKEVEDYGDSYRNHFDFIQIFCDTIQNDERLHQEGIQILNAITFMGTQTDTLAAIPISAQERSQAFASLSRVFLGSQVSTPDYQNITWRSGLLNILLESECQIGERPVIGSLATEDNAWIQEVQQHPWDLHQSSQLAELPDRLDALTLWHTPEQLEQEWLSMACSKLKRGGILILAMRRSRVHPESVRTELENMTNSTCYLIDRESFSDILVAYIINGHLFSPQIKVLIVAPPYSVWTFGGLEWQLFKSRAFFKQRGIRSDITLSCRLEPTEYDAVYVLGYSFEDYKINWLNSILLPKIYMAIPVIFGVEKVMSQHFGEQLKQFGLEYPKNDLISQLINFDFLSLRQKIEIERSKMATEVEQIQRIAQSCDYFVPQSLMELQVLFPTRDPAMSPHQLVVNGSECEMIQAATSELFLQTHQLQPDFILCVGRIEVNKNQLLLCLALRETELPLVLIGSIEDPVYFQMCLAVSNGKVKHFQNLSDEMLVSALKAAKLFVLPSCSEVFPLATAEAALAGCPVVSTQNSGQSELFGDAFDYFDPFDIVEMQRTISNVYHADNTEKVAKAQAIATKYIPTWPQMANQIADILYMQARYRHHPGLILHANRWYLLAHELHQSTEYGLPVAYEVHDSQLGLLGQKFELNQPILSALLLVHTDYTKYQLQQWGATHITKQGLTFTETKHISLPTKWQAQSAVICIYDEANLFGWQETVKVALGVFSKATGLLIYIPTSSTQESAEAHIMRVLSALDPPAMDAENIILLTGIHTPELELALFAQADAIIFPLKRLWGCESFWLRLMTLQTPIITHVFDRDVFKPQDLSLYDFEEVCEFSCDELIPVDEIRLEQAVRQIVSTLRKT